MKKSIIIVWLIFSLAFPIFCYAGDNLPDLPIELLVEVEVDGYQISFFGFQGDKPGFLKKIFPPKRSREFDIMIDSEGVKIFSYQQLDAMVEKAKDKLKSLYLNGARLKIIVIKEKKK
jgi:hypothetical protein